MPLKTLVIRALGGRVARLLLVLAIGVLAAASLYAFVRYRRGVEEGKARFQRFCANCHGVSARGGPFGPDLVSRELTQGDRFIDLYRTIRRGVPDTVMGPQGFDRWKTATLVFYLQALRQPQRDAVRGDPASGERVFFQESNCSLCHAIRGQGGRLGPDLAGIGRARSLEYLTTKIRNPSLHVLPDYQTVSIVTRKGQRIRGRRMNEDSFSIQLMAADETLCLYLKQDLATVVHEAESLMPAYDEQSLSEKQIRDLAAFLAGRPGRKD